MRKKIKISELSLVPYKFKGSGNLFLYLTLCLKLKFEIMKLAKVSNYLNKKGWKKNQWDQYIHYFSPKYLKEDLFQEKDVLLKKAKYTNFVICK